MTLVDRILKALFSALLSHFVPKLKTFIVEGIENKRTEEEIVRSMGKAMGAINRPIDPTLPKEEREKQSEKNADDFFDSLT